jgi:hypothetical protein
VSYDFAADPVFLRIKVNRGAGRPIEVAERAQFDIEFPGTDHKSDVL